MQIVRPVTITSTVMTSTVAQTESAWSSGTTYALGAVVFRYVDNVARKYTSLQNSNTNHTPETSPTWWTDNGATNRWAMFDETIGSLTSNADSIGVTIVLPATERVDTLYFAGLSATSVRVKVTDLTAGLVYDQTITLSDVGAVTDWYAWFFEPVRRLGELVVSGLPSGAGSTIEVTIAETGATVTCGTMVAGFSQELGGTRWGAGLGIRDFSVKDTDAFGNSIVVERAYRKKATFQIIVDNRLLDSILATLAECRASVRLYIGDSGYASTAVLGFYRDFNIELSLPPNNSLCSLELEGLA